MGSTNGLRISRIIGELPLELEAIMNGTEAFQEKAEPGRHHRRERQAHVDQDQ